MCGGEVRVCKSVLSLQEPALLQAASRLSLGSNLPHAYHILLELVLPRACSFHHKCQEYETKSNHAAIFKALEIIPLAKISHMITSSIREAGNYVPPTMGRYGKATWQMG